MSFKGMRSILERKLSAVMKSKILIFDVEASVRGQNQHTKDEIR